MNEKMKWIYIEDHNGNLIGKKFGQKSAVYIDLKKYWKVVSTTQSSDHCVTLKVYQ